MFDTRKKIVAALASVALIATAAACSPQETSAEPDQLSVLAAFYPLAFVAEQVGGDRVDVTTLTPQGAEPHDLELAPAQTRQIGAADLVLFQTRFQPALDAAVEARNPDHVLDAASLATRPLVEDPDHDHEQEGEDDHDHGPNDPHFWLDPELFETFAQQVAAELTALDPEGASYFEANLATLSQELDQLDQDFAAGLASCAHDSIIVTHEAFGYVADRYDFSQISIVGVDPEAEPSPAQLKQVSATIVDLGIETIFFETLVSPKVAETLARDLGIETRVLDPIEGITKENQTYFTIMDANLEALAAGMQCS